MSISFEDGMKILALARQNVQAAPAAAVVQPQHTSVLSDEQAHALQLMMLITGQDGSTVGRGGNHVLDGLADAIKGAGRAVSRISDAVNGVHDVTPKPGSKPYQLPPNAHAPVVSRDDRQQEAARGKDRAQWAGRMADHQGTPSSDEPGWTN